MNIDIPVPLQSRISPDMLDDMIFFDTETTGIDITGNQDDPQNKANSILEIALVRTKELRVVDKLHFFIDFEGDIPKEASNVHGITNQRMHQMRENAKKYESMFSGSPDIREIRKISTLTQSLNPEKVPAIPWRKAAIAINSLFSQYRNNGATLCAHSLSFDVKWINFMMRRSISEALREIGKNQEFIERTCQRELVYLSRHPHNCKIAYIDTIVCSEALWKGDQKSNTLDAAADRLKIDRSARAQYHGAMIDTLLLVDVFRGMLGLSPYTFRKTN